MEDYFVDKITIFIYLYENKNKHVKLFIDKNTLLCINSAITKLCVSFILEAKFLYQLNNIYIKHI